MKIISRDEAGKLGLKRFYTGVPCRHGHITYRYTFNRRCVECDFNDQLKNGKKYVDKYHQQTHNQLSIKRNEKQIRAVMLADILSDNICIRRNQLVKIWRDSNPDKVKASRKRNHNPATVAAYTMKRMAMKLQATPLWANLEEIKYFYVEAARLTKETGIKHEVDHRVPLKSKIVCGLHCPLNLRVITKDQNRKKSNKFDPDTFE